MPESGVWGWVYESLRDFKSAAAAGDTARDRLLRLYYEALTEPLTLLQRDPGRAFTLLTEGRELADRSGEPGWVLLLDHWRARALREMVEYRAARDVAMRAVMYARKPPFVGFPQRFCVHLDDVVHVVIRMDPEGYAPQIREAFSYVAGEITPDLECSHCLPMYQSYFALQLDQFDEAHDYALRALACAGGHPFHEARALHRLCAIAARQDDWQAIQGWAIDGEAAARQSQRPSLIVAFLAWQAVVARNGGDERTARRLFQAATTQARAVGGIAGGRHEYSYPVCLYHEAGGEYERALAIRGRQIARVAGQGLTHEECCFRLAECRLLAQLDRPLAQNIATLRTAAAGLKHPQSFLKYVDELGT